MSEGNFSKPPDDVLADALSKGYVGVRFEQGVPLLDRDLNLMGDLLAETTRRIFEMFIGNGVSGAGAFRIEIDPDVAKHKQLFETQNAVPASTPVLAGATPNELWINGPGECMCGGILVKIPARMRYGEQKGFVVPRLTTPTAESATIPFFGGLKYRMDLVYLHVELSDENGDPAGDYGLQNEDDVGMRTSIRKKAAWKVLVKEGLDVASWKPSYEWRSSSDRFAADEIAFPDIQRPFLPLALLVRFPGEPWIGRISDVRVERVNVVELVRRVNAIEEAFAPAILKFEPMAAGEGMKVTIQGRNLDVGTPLVYFGKQNAIVDQSTASRTQLDVTVPADIGTQPVEVRVVTTLGVAVAGDAFSPVGKPVFAATGQISPPSGKAGVTVTLSGASFGVPHTKVLFGSTPATDVVVKDGAHITATVPPTLSPDSYKVTVTTPGGSVLSTELFTVLTTPIIKSTGGVNPQFVDYLRSATMRVGGSGLNGPNLRVSLFGYPEGEDPPQPETADVASPVVTPDGASITFDMPIVYKGSWQVVVEHDGGKAVSAESISVH